MPVVDLVKRCDVSQSPRALQLQSMFDVPPNKRHELRWKIDVPIESFDWNIGLIVGASGSGKTSIATEMFGKAAMDFADGLKWGKPSVVDDFNPKLSIEAISETCQSVGFNTIPAWLRPYRVLSNGEQFRVKLARLLLEYDKDTPIVFDEFSSVVDRQVAKIASHAIQKAIRRHHKKFVAVSCHSDIIDWLQPDWVLDVSMNTFTRRSLRRRPDINVRIGHTPYSTWRMFAPFHYLTADMHRNARCFLLECEGRPAAFAGVIHTPHATPNLKAVSRLVTLPDYQGLGLAFVLVETLAAAYAALGWSLHTRPAHPTLIRNFDKSPLWKMTQRPGQYAKPGLTPSSLAAGDRPHGARPCAGFKYVGPIDPDVEAAKSLLGIMPFKRKRMPYGFRPKRLV